MDFWTESLEILIQNFENNSIGQVICTKPVPFSRFPQPKPKLPPPLLLLLLSVKFKRNEQPSSGLWCRGQTGHSVWHQRKTEHHFKASRQRGMGKRRVIVIVIIVGIHQSHQRTARAIVMQSARIRLD